MSIYRKIFSKLPPGDRLTRTVVNGDRVESVDDLIHLTVEEASKCILAAAEGDPQTVHVHRGMDGSDWEVRDVLGLLMEARDIAWMPGGLIPGHDLWALVPQGRGVLGYYRIGVVAPAHVIAYEESR